MTLREVTYLAVILRIFVAALFGGAIGLERGMKNRPAGLRTYMLVCVGSCLIMLTNQYLFQVSGAGDPMRLGAQVVSGIGFLGAGTIIVTTRSQIKGLTTAAGLWASACLGLAVGVGFYEVALIGGFCVLLVLTIFHSWENYMRRNTAVLSIYIELNPGIPLGQFLREIQEQQINMSNIQMQSETISGQDLAFLATIKPKKKETKDSILTAVRALPTVQFVEEL